jgi:hypothetical protein
MNKGVFRLRFVIEVLKCIMFSKRSFEYVSQSSRVLTPTTLVVASGVLSGIATYNYYRSSLPSSVFLGLLAVISFLGVVMNWVLSSALLHASSRIMGGAGRLRTIFALNAVASAPLLIQNLLRIYDSVQSPNSGWRLITLLNSMEGLSLKSAIYYFTLFRIWAILLSAVAVMVTYKTSGKRSALAAATSALGLFLVYALLAGQVP